MAIQNKCLQHVVFFSFNIYKFRIFQSIKLYRKNIHRLNKPTLLFLKYKLAAMLKLFIYRSLYFINLDSILIRRRNQKLSENDINKYQKILDLCS